MKDPLKQGLKHKKGPIIKHKTTIVEVKDPLKQGLKLNYIFKNISLWYKKVEVKDPLKQGLKRYRLKR